MPRSRLRFTLVELLVVISIVALLASMLLPALARARTHAKRTANTSNHRQAVLAMISYSDESDGFVPYSNRPSGTGTGYYHPVPYGWDEASVVTPLMQHGLLPSFLRSPTVGTDAVGSAGLIPGELCTLSGHPQTGDYISSIAYWPGKQTFNASWTYRGQWFDATPPVADTRAFIDPALLIFTDLTEIGTAGGWAYITHSKGRTSWIIGSTYSPAGAMADIMGNTRTYADGHSEWVDRTKMGRNGGDVGTVSTVSRYSHLNSGTGRGYFF